MSKRFIFIVITHIFIYGDFVDPYIFMAYDIRGIYNSQFDDKDAYKIGLAYANLVRNKNWITTKNFAVGMDARNSGPEIKRELLDGMTDGGLNVVDIGMVSTPIFYFSIVQKNLDGGIMITASHNPKEYNGFKIQRRNAFPITGEGGIYEMRDYILDGKLKKFEKGNVSKENIIDDYINYLSKKGNFDGLRIVIDNGNGAFGFIPEKIFEKYNCNVKTLYGEPDGSFPNHIADPHRYETLKKLQSEVVESDADVGFAFDGDGDRLGVVDEKGRIITEDFVLMMLSRKALEKKKGVVIVDTRATMALTEDIVKHGGTPIMSKCGHAYILEKIFETNAVFGGEASGHMYFPQDYYPYDDGMFIALKMAELIYDLKSKGTKLSEYYDSLPRYISTKEYSFECPNEKKFSIVENIKKDIKSHKDYYGLKKIIDIDGVRIETDNAWGLVRVSNTSPKIKCRFESKDKDGLEAMKKIIFDLLNKYGVKTNENE